MSGASSRLVTRVTKLRRGRFVTLIAELQVVQRSGEVLPVETHTFTVDREAWSRMQASARREKARRHHLRSLYRAKKR